MKVFNNVVPLVIFCPRSISGGSHNYWLNLIAEKGFIDRFHIEVVAQSGPETTRIKKKLGTTVKRFVEYPSDKVLKWRGRLGYYAPRLRSCQRAKALRQCLQSNSRKPLVWFLLDGFFSIGWCADSIDYCIQAGIPFHLIVQHANEFITFSDEHGRDKARKLFESARRVVFVSQRNREAAEICLGCELENAEVGVNGLTESAFDKAYALGTMSPPKTFGKTRIINIARYDIAYKRQDLLLRSLSGLGSETERCDVTLVGGSGSDRWFIESLMHYCGLPLNKIHFVDHSDDPLSLLVTHDLFALTSESEGMAFALVEAAAACRPLLATDVAGAESLVIDNETGYLAGAATLKAVMKALENALNDQVNWVSRGLAAHHLARERFCLRRVVIRAYENAIEDLSR
jgi:glycosyltransferase involved in cell wall biosynthesis